jgi:hypothetical protein
MNMGVFTDVLNQSCAIEFACIILITGDIGVGRSDCLSARTQLLVAGLYIIFVMFLKHRAAPHRRTRRWINTCGKNSTHLWVHLKETIHCSPKMTPSSCPLLSGIWRVLCYVLVWELYPRPFVLLYTSIACMSHLTQWAVTAFLSGSVKQGGHVIHNGRHFKIIWIGLEYSKIQDTDQNVLYYPTIDLYRLLPSDIHK